MIVRIAIALAVASFPAAVSAGQAEICYSAPVNYALHQPPTNATVFACPVAGSQQCCRTGRARMGSRAAHPDCDQLHP